MKTSLIFLLLVGCQHSNHEETQSTFGTWHFSKCVMGKIYGMDCIRCEGYGGGITCNWNNYEEEIKNDQY